MENVSFFKRFLPNRISKRSRRSSCLSKADAVECFADRSFSNVPACWIAELLEHRGQPVAMPMYSMLFLIDDKSVEQAVERNLAEYDFGEDIDRQRLIECGWRVVCPTGLFVLPLDGRFLIGVDGCGYDFFDAHWEPLYDLLGYMWHLDD